MLAWMNTSSKTLAIFAMLLLPCFAGGTESRLAPRITHAPDAPLTPVRFSIPRYTLTAHEREVVAACLVLEAASQGDLGLRGVMAVIRNRSRALPELFAPTVLRRKQFSAMNSATSGQRPLSHLIERAKRDSTWPRALEIVDKASHDSWWDPTAGATHYTLSTERNRWTRKLQRTVIIGAHSFYR